jgi:hypothetical protein
MNQLEKPLGKPLKECKCLNEFITNFRKSFLNDQRLNRGNFINKQVVTINGEKYKHKGIDHEAQDEAISKLWYEYKHELYEGILSIVHHPDCELVLDVERMLKDDQYAISNKISKMEKEYLVEEISERRREIFSLLNGPAFDVLKVKAYYKTIYYYTRLIELHDGKNVKNDIIKEFKDIIDVKFHSLIPDFFKLLGTHFPDYYDNNGVSKNSKRNRKSIISSWYACLRSNNVVIIYPNKDQKDDIARILSKECRFDSLTEKTLFDEKLSNDPCFKSQLINLDKSVKMLIKSI